MPKIGFIEIIRKCVKWKHKLIVFPHHRSMNKYLILFLIVLLVLSILCTALKLSFENSNEKKLWYLPVEDLSVSNLFLSSRYAVCDVKSILKYREASQKTALKSSFLLVIEKGGCLQFYWRLISQRCFQRVL